MSSDFAAALEAGDLAELRAIPKADLHNHFTFGGNRAFVREKTGIDVAPLDHALQSMDEMHEWAGKHISPAFQGLQGRMLGIEATFVQARLDGVTRLDGGEDVWAMTLWDRDVPRLTQALRDIHARVAPEIEWTPQMGVSRHCPIQYVMEWSAPFLELDFYQTVDLYADEFAQPIGVFKPVYRAARAKGLRLRAHAGEWGTADDVWQAVEELELDEVQHGIAAATSPQVMRFLADNKIRLNVCPTSNIMLGRVESMAVHPIRKLFDAGVIVTVNTDDALMFGIGVTDEYLSLYWAGVFTADELDQIRRNGLTDQPLRG